MVTDSWSHDYPAWGRYVRRTNHTRHTAPNACLRDPCIHTYHIHHVKIRTGAIIALPSLGVDVIQPHHCTLHFGPASWMHAFHVVTTSRTIKESAPLISDRLGSGSNAISATAGRRALCGHPQSLKYGRPPCGRFDAFHSTMCKPVCQVQLRPRT
nr:hypothetical protein CFP56_73942 [Quercus suber]